MSEIDQIAPLILETHPWPFGNFPGCYVFYCEQMGLIYIGKASNSNNIGDRVGSYFRSRGLPAPEAKHKWPRPLYFVQAIKVREAFEAPSLEEFLVRDLKPIGNEI